MMRCMEESALVLAALLSVSCAKVEPQRLPGDPLQEEATRKFRRCSHDADCVYAQNGCFDCVNGGREVAVNRSQAQAFRAVFTCDERTPPCTMVDRIPACGSGIAFCVQGLCEYEYRLDRAK